LCLIRDYFEPTKNRPAKSLRISPATGPKSHLAYIHRVEVGLRRTSLSISSTVRSGWVLRRSAMSRAFSCGVSLSAAGGVLRAGVAFVPALACFPSGAAFVDSDEVVFVPRGTLGVV